MPSTSSAKGSPNSSSPGYARRIDLSERHAAVHADAGGVEPFAQQRAFEGLVADRRDLLERCQELHVPALRRELLGDPAQP